MGRSKAGKSTKNGTSEEKGKEPKSKKSKMEVDDNDDSEQEDNSGSSEEEEEYVVESILDCRTRRGKKEYYIKWKDFDDEDDNTWEPIDNLDCAERIKEFHENQSKEDGSSKGKTKSRSSTGRAPLKRRADSSDSEPVAKVSRNAQPSPLASDGAKGGDKNKKGKGSKKGSQGMNFKININSQDQKGTSEKDNSEPTGFERGLEPERILGAAPGLPETGNKDLLFLIKWKDSEDADLVPAKLANVKCPQLVIAFYEERVAWETGE